MCVETITITITVSNYTITVLNNTTYGTTLLIRLIIAITLTHEKSKNCFDAKLFLIVQSTINV